MRKNKKQELTQISKNQKIIGSILIVVIIIGGFFFLSNYPGFLFNPPLGPATVGWANIEVCYIGFDYSLQQMDDNVVIDLYYVENSTKYDEGLTLNDFPIYLQRPTMFLLKSTTGDFQYHYSLLIGSDNYEIPYVNEVFLKREVSKDLVNVHASIINFTSFENNPLNTSFTQYRLFYNSSAPKLFLFNSSQSGQPRLEFNITNIPFGYTWGASTIIPPEIFEENNISRNIAYFNGYNRIGLNLAFDCSINLSILVYGSEISQFFIPVQVFEINLTQFPTPEKLWVAPISDVDINRNLVFQFETRDIFDTIYIWSGWLDDFNTSYKFNTYS